MPLRVDQAWLQISTTTAQPLYVYTLAENCVRCPFSRWLRIDSAATKPIRRAIGTAYSQRWRLYAADQGPLVYANR